MRRNGINVDTTVRFPDPDFLLKCKISAIWRRFPLIIAFYILNVRHIYTSGLTYWPRKYTTRVDPHVDNSHQVWSWYDHTLPSYSVFVCWHVTWPCDLYLWPFDLEQLQCMAGHVTNLATKLEYPMPIRSWFMRYNVFHWLPLRMRTRPLRMRWTAWPMSTGVKNNYIFGMLDPDLPIHYATSLALRWK